MLPDQLKSLAEQLAEGSLSLDGFLREVARPQTADLGEVQLDLDRRRRCGFPEVVFGEGKTLATLEKTIERMVGDRVDVLVTRTAPEVASALQHRFPAAEYNSAARTLRIRSANENERSAAKPERAKVAVVSAGTTDRPVAEEAMETLRWMGVEVKLIQDVGVAGPHRLREHLAELEDVAAVVVVAGMEGALPSVVGGYVACPVIAVPTSVGYGANFGGLAALLSMLNSCAANVTVVNIDAGFKAGYVAGLIANGRTTNH
ncbi:MAG: nickel pincer cofactor biosynthesis protein LarB [Pirellulales bacterium]|nr:nickel pincer cofactor biosynthesis protein LarB [Pirellulales bacterium]